MDAFISTIKYKGEPCIKMGSGRYVCVIAPSIGSNIIRLYDTENDIELVNFDRKIPMKWIKHPSLVVGMPSLLFPNRIGGGVLKTSDATYSLPINETNYNNHIHGFVHARPHHIVNCLADNQNSMCSLTTEYIYDEKDDFFVHFPVKFTLRIMYTLSPEGLRHEISITNNSNVMFPFGVGTHTSMKAPFSKHGKKKNLRITIPVTGKCELNDSILCTGNVLEPDSHDNMYRTGDALPVLNDIDNEMYTFDTLTLPDGRNIHGLIVSDCKNGKSIVYELDDSYKFLILWNCGGDANFFCPEPISWMIDAPNIDCPSDVTGYRELKPGEEFSCWQQLSSMVI